MLLQAHRLLKASDNSISDTIEIELIVETDKHNDSDKVRYEAQSIYAECANHFIGTNKISK